MFTIRNRLLQAILSRPATVWRFGCIVPVMRESERIADQLRRAFNGEAWHGPAVMEVLTGIGAEQALAHPVPGAHSIWEIVAHIRGWHDAIVHRMQGEVVRYTATEDWPPITDTSELDWQDELHALRAAHAKAYSAFRDFPDERLTQTVPGKSEGDNFYVELHGLVQHNLYHAGQIAVLKKALGL